MSPSAQWPSGPPDSDSGAELPAEVREPLLPPELPWLYAVIPLPAAYLVGHNLLHQPLPLALLLLKAYLPFFAYGGAFHLAYRHLMPALLRRTCSAVVRATLHAAALLVVVPAVSLPLVPCMEYLLQRTLPQSHLLVSYIFSAACLFPALCVQQLRHRARTAEHRALRERKAALEAQLAALQARTDPHFLFNSINTVASLIPEDPELAERSLERLADLFRYALESSRVRTVRLERELAMVADYLALQTTRFGARLRVRLSVASGLGDVEVPPLLLQPLVENAIMHGTAQRRGGQVHVDVRRTQDRLIIEVSDDGPGPGRSSHAGTGTSVTSLVERLRLHYDASASLSLSSQPGGGCLARLALPIASRA
ncbi:MAG TPA: histidine kinase [Polyangiales bacterium]